MGIKFSIELEGVEKSEAFENFISDLPVFMRKKGLNVTGKNKKSIEENGIPVGAIQNVSSPDNITLSWYTSATWDKEETSNFIIEFHSGSKPNKIAIAVSSEDWGEALKDKGQSTMEWFMEEVVASFFSSISPERFSNWLLDSRARTPTGKMARKTYGNPLYHWPNFRKILEDLKLTSSDNLLDIGCGGGAFLKEALKSGCKASAIDHSLDMVSLAREQNSKSIDAGKLEVQYADAMDLPFEDETFTAVVCTGAFNFISDPDKFFNEVFRVMKNGGRFMLFTGTKDLKGTPAAPEPIGSMIYYHEDNELQGLSDKAGFVSISVTRPSLEKYAIESGLPSEVVEFFKQSGAGGQLLYAVKPA